jgi:arylsulfatase A-like enzyme
VFTEAPLLAALSQPFAAVVDQARAWLAEPRPTPFFLFLHNYEVHMPYEESPPYDRMFDPDYDGQFAPRISAKQWSRMGDPDQGWMSDRDVEHLRARYDGAIRHMDLAFGALLDTLEAQGLGDSTCVVLTADHGEEFREHGDVGHARAKLYTELVKVPLIIRCPERFAAGAAVETPVGLFDVAPTILELAGVPTPALDGSATLSNGLARSVRSDGHTFISSTIWGQPSEQLFDTGADPGERREIGAAHPEIAARMRALLAAGIGPPPAAVPDTPIPAPTPDAAARERLRILGY